MSSRAFEQVDVFSKTPYLGNPVAVVLDGDGLTEDEMGRLARWTNLSETTFVLTPTNPAADYRLRIFTPGGELPFAGHPTLGSAHAWLHAGGQPKSSGLVIQECGVGLVQLRNDVTGEGKKQLSFKAPPTVHSGAIESDVLDEVVKALGLEPAEVIAHQVVDNGPGWICVQLASAEKVLSVTPKFREGSTLMLGLVGEYPRGSETSFELRAFAPKIGVYEDPVTGSLNASVAQWFYRTGFVTGPYLASQGNKVGRSGIIALSLDENGEVWVGGNTTTLIVGDIDL